MHTNETRFARALAEAADEANLDLTTDDITTLRAEHWHTYPEVTRATLAGPPEDAALALAGEVFNPDYRKHRR